MRLFAKLTKQADHKSDRENGRSNAPAFTHVTGLTAAKHLWAA
jgi:hypothetical protein